MKKILIIALILLLLASSSLGMPNNEHSRRPETIIIELPFPDCHNISINFTTIPPVIKCFNFDFQV